MSQQSEQTLHAPMKWAQRHDKVYLTISVPDCKPSETTIEFSEDKLEFKAETESGDKYACTLPFFAAIDKDQVKVDIRAREIPMMIQKTELAFWPRLSKEKVKLHWLATDFEKWVDEEDSDGETEKKQKDFEQMMQKMGNWNPNDKSKEMPDVEYKGLEDDSDDEDLPDLE